jgi:ribonuclease P protein subunit POP4
MIHTHNLLAHELIGLRVRVLKSPDRSLIGIEGEVVDETKNLLVLKSKGKEKKIPKKLVFLRIFLPTGSPPYVDVPGELLVARPEDRLKKFWRKKYGKLWRQKLPHPRRPQDKRSGDGRKDSAN